MTLPSNARLAGTAYLLYIATGIGSMAAPAEIRPVLGTVMAFCALALGVTLYAITRHVDRDLALVAMLCRVLEAGSGSGEIYFAVGSTIFCWLLLKGRTIPTWLSLLGLLSSGGRRPVVGAAGRWRQHELVLPHDMVDLVPAVDLRAGVRRRVARQSAHAPAITGMNSIWCSRGRHPRRSDVRQEGTRWTEART